MDILVQINGGKELISEMKLCRQRTFNELMGVISEGIQPDDLVEAIVSCLPPAKQNSVKIKAALITLLERMEK